MNNKEIDDIQYALKEVFTIYGKELDDQVSRLWVKSLSAKPVDLLLRAIQEYPKHGKFAPKPIDILELVDRIKVETHRPAPVVHHRSDPVISRAWITYMRFAHNFDYKPGIESMPLDECLDIVNREASKYGNRDAILPEHRINNYWAAA